MPKRVEKSETEWRAELTPEQYEVARRKGTEPAFSGKLWDAKDEGVYRCVCCGLPLFRSDEKYDSGTGWPSFWDPIDPSNLKTKLDATHGMVRTEVLCSACDAHLGHVFPDGPPPSGNRYCMNSAALRLEKKDQ